MNYINLILLFILLIYGSTEINCDCSITIGSNDLQKPEIWKPFGSNNLQIQTSAISRIDMKTNTELIAKCADGFQSPTAYASSRELHIECKESIYIDSKYYGSNSITTDCKAYTYSWKLYESSNSFSWCDKQYVSYIVVGRTSNVNQFDYVSAICYDIKNMKFISIYYSLRNIYNKNEYPKVLEKYKLGKEVENIREVFSTKILNASLYDTSELQTLYYLSNYQFSSTVQNTYLYDNIYEGFGSFIDVIWWPNLRFGNWKRYERELSKQNEKESFNIMTGISDITKAPIENQCSSDFVMVEFKDNAYRDHVPLYIWNYAKSNVNETNEYVIIGVNSPFYEYYNEDAVVFCNDICEQIDWLSRVYSTFRHTTMGVIFCCSVDEVQKSNRLDGFPENTTILFN